MTVDLVFLAGVLSFFSPCTVPLLPVFFAQLANSGVSEDAADNPGLNALHAKLIFRTLLFVVGISSSFVLMGFGAGFIGQVLGSQSFLVVCGLLAIVLGLHQTGLFRIQWLERQKTLDSILIPRSGFLGAFLLGFVFSFGWTPCVGPVLATVLALASSQGQSLGAAQLMLVYSAGLAMPFVLISVMGVWTLDRTKSLHRYLPKIQVASGLLIIIMGLLLLTNNLNILAFSL